MEGSNYTPRLFFLFVCFWARHTLSFSFFGVNLNHLYFIHGNNNLRRLHKNNLKGTITQPPCVTIKCLGTYVHLQVLWVLKPACKCLEYAHICSQVLRGMQAPSHVFKVCTFKGIFGYAHMCLQYTFSLSKLSLSNKIQGMPPLFL